MEMREIINHTRKKILTKGQVIGVGRGFKEVGGERTEDEAIHVPVRKKLPISQLRRRDMIPMDIYGYPTDVIEVGELKVLITSRTERKRPAMPGLSIGHYKVTAGTFGAVVYDRDTGHPLILSNNHVLANTSSRSNPRAEKGDPILQPGKYDKGTVKDIIGYLERYAPLSMSVTTKEYKPKGFSRILSKLRGKSKSGEPNRQIPVFNPKAENIVDCAVAVPISNDVISDKILKIGRIRGIGDPQLGDLVQKSGRTTGLTKGRVRTLDATVSVAMGANEQAVFSNQLILDHMSEGGDSGSLVLDMGDRAVGLLFAGSREVTVCNPIDAVLDALNVTL